MTRSTQIEQRSVVAITGAVGGLGSALVRGFLDRGCFVVAVVKPGSPENIADVSDDCATRLSYEHTDLAVRADVRALAEQLVKAHPSIEWLVHCAGYIATDGAAEPLDRTFEVNTFAPIILTSLCKDAIAAGGGVIFVSSTAGLWGGATPLYSASKSALHGFAFSLQKSFGSERSSIVVCPGPTKTPMREAHAHDATQHQSPKTVATILLEDVLGSRDNREQKLFVIRKGMLDQIACKLLR